jgi:hypothetical protein
MPSSNNTPLFFEFLTSFDYALANSGVNDYANGTITETVTDSDGVVWTQVFEYAVQSSAGTATETATITNTNGFSAVMVLTADNYSGSVADLMGQNSVFDNESSDLTGIATGDFGDFNVVFPAPGDLETWSGEFVTVDGGLLTSVNLQIHFDNQDMAVGNGSAIRDGQTITFDDFVFYDLPTLELSNYSGSSTLTSNNTPLFFEFWTSFDNALANSGVTDYVNSTITESITDVDGVVWTQVFEYTIQAVGGIFAAATVTDAGL